MKIDKFTYGDTRAAVKLAEIVESNKEGCNHLSLKVGRIWDDFNIGLVSLVNSDLHFGFKKQLISMWHENAKVRIERSSLPTEVKNFLRNAVSTRFKILKKGVNDYRKDNSKSILE